MKRHFDLALCCAIAALCALLMCVGFTEVTVRSIVGLPTVLIVPGYVLGRALFPARPRLTTTGFVTAFGLSLCIAILVGLALNWSPWGLNPVSWALTLLVLTLMFAICAYWRSERSCPDLVHLSMPRLGVGRSVLLVVSLGLVVGAVMVARWGADTAPAAGFTQLWLLPADDVPVAGDRITLEVGIRCEENERTSYSLVVAISPDIEREWTSIELAPGETWRSPLEVRDPRGSYSKLEAEATLFKTGAQDTPYRHVSLH